MAMIGSILPYNLVVTVSHVEKKYQKVNWHYGQDQVNQ